MLAFCWGLLACAQGNGWTELREWLFRRHTDSVWTQVRLPHSCNAEDGRSKSYYRGLAHYKTTFYNNSGQSSGKSLHSNKKHAATAHTLLYFMGAAQKCEVRVNGHVAMRHGGGYTPFVVDATPFVREGENLVEVDCDNTLDANLAPVSSDFNKNNGLHNPAYLIQTGDVFPNLELTGYDGMHITPSNISPQRADIGVSTVVSNRSDRQAKVSIRIAVKDKEDRTVAKDKATILLPPNSDTPIRRLLTLHHPHLWQGRRNPYLYSVNMTMKEGSTLLSDYTAPTGIRTIAMDSLRGFMLNGRSYPLRGMSLHQDWAHSASAVTRAQTNRDFQIIEDLGATVVRLAHYPHNPYILHKCDSLGLIVQTEIPWVNECGTDTSLYSPKAYSDNLHLQLSEMIHSHYNHPSIAFWGLWNELGNIDWRHPQGKHLDKQAVLNTTASLYALAHSLDSTRFVGFADAAFGMATPELKRSTHFDYFAFNAYNGWYQNCKSPEGAQQFKNTLRRLHHRSPYAAITEYGAGANPFCHSLHPGLTTRPSVGGARHDEEWANIVHERHLQILSQTPWLQFSTGWILFDFAVADRKEGWITDSLLRATPAGEKPTMPPHAAWLNDKGLVSRDRLTFKDSYFLYRAAWNKLSPTIYITSRRFQYRPADTLSSKGNNNNPASDSLSLRNNDNNLASDSLSIKVYSNLRHLCLYQDGRLVQTLEQSGEPSGVIWQFAPIPFPHSSAASPTASVSTLIRVEGTDPSGHLHADEVRFFHQ